MSSFGSEFIEISPITKMKTITFTKMLIAIDSISIGKNAALIKVILYTELHDEIKEFFYELRDAEYMQWTGDDYLVSWVKSKLKFENF